MSVQLSYIGQIIVRRDRVGIAPAVWAEWLTRMYGSPYLWARSDEELQAILGVLESAPSGAVFEGGGREQEAAGWQEAHDAVYHMLGLATLQVQSREGEEWLTRILKRLERAVSQAELEQWLEEGTRLLVTTPPLDNPEAL